MLDWGIIWSVVMGMVIYNGMALGLLGLAQLAVVIGSGWGNKDE